MDTHGLSLNNAWIIHGEFMDYQWISLDNLLISMNIRGYQMHEYQRIFMDIHGYQGIFMDIHVFR